MIFKSVRGGGTKINLQGSKDHLQLGVGDAIGFTPVK
jgi:hypothetical protein